MLIVGWLAGWVLLWRLPGLRRPPAPTEADLPAYAVVIPARDEAHNLGPLLAQLQHQTVAPAEIVVVDDHSSDGTADVAAAAGARVVPSRSLPPGWVGKTWACQQGADATDAPVLVFLDADVRLAPDAMAAVVSEQARRGGLLSVAPWHTVRRPYEWFSLVFGIVALMGVGAATPGARRVRGAFGPCIVLRRRDYDAFGGHASVAGQVVEDLALADQATAHGLTVSVLGGRPLLTYRMYPQGMRSLLEGWTKNIATGARRSDPLRSVLAATWIAGGIVASWQGLTGGWVGAVVLALWLVQVARMSRQIGSFPVFALLAFPLLLAWFLFVFVRSVILTSLRHEVQWRGRHIPVTRGAVTVAERC